MNTVTVAQEIELHPQECIDCGVVFALTVGLDRRLRQTHRDFYCPNGHPQRYIAETEAERLRKDLTKAQDALARAERRATANGEAAEAARREAERMRTRAERGVCPYCHRSFASTHMQRHVRTKHPETQA